MKSKLLDQFYTNPEIAKMCINLLQETLKSKDTVYVEPAAGTGSFSSMVKKCISVDIDPKVKGMIKGDFLKLSKEDIVPKAKSKDVCFIGNPPFGKNSSLAIKFFNHASHMGDVIAFILPKTFRKESVHAKLNKNFWLIKDIDLPKNSFIHNDSAHDTPCCFQIWKRKKEIRKMNIKKTTELFDFVKKSEADFAVRRVGGRSGKVIEDFNHCAEVSHYFLKVKKGTVKELIAKIDSIDMKDTVNSTAGVRSLSKSELIQLVESV